MSKTRLEVKLTKDKSEKNIVEVFEAFRSIDIIDLMQGFLNSDADQTDVFFQRLVFLQKDERDKLTKWGEEYFKDVIAKKIPNMNTERELTLFIALLAYSLIKLNYNIEELDGEVLQKLNIALFNFALSKKHQIIYLHDNEAKGIFNIFSASEKQGIRADEQICTVIVGSNNCLWIKEPGFDTKYHSDISWIAAAAEAGCTDAILNFGRCLRDGLFGVEKNIESARFLFKTAAAQGDVDALYEYAQTLEDNEQEKWRLVRLSAMNDHLDARSDLVKLFYVKKKLSFFQKLTTSKHSIEADIKNETEAKMLLSPTFIYHAAMEFQIEAIENAHKVDIMRLKICSNLLRTQPALVEQLARDVNDSPEQILSFLEDDEVAMILATQEYILSSSDKRLPPPLLRLIADYAFYQQKNLYPAKLAKFENQILSPLEEDLPKPVIKLIADYAFRREIFFPAATSAKPLEKKKEDEEMSQKSGCIIS